MGKSPAFAFAAILLFHAAPTLHGQCGLARTVSHPGGCGATSGDEQLLPEDGYLAADTYTSRFFGFSVNLPIASDGHRITIPVMLEKQHALLAIGFEQGKHFGTLTITAEESPAELEQYDDMQGEQCSDTAGTVSPMRRPIPGRVLRYGAFYANVHRWGAMYADHFWTRIKTYIIRVSVDSNDQEFLQKSKHALMKADFYCTRGGKLTTSDGRVVEPKGQPYEGPTVPTWRADAAINNKPGLSIPAGELSDGVYRNPSLGLQYELPNGWDLVREEISGDPPHNPRSLREYELLHACSRVLLHAVQRGPHGAKPDIRPTIMLRALDPSCLSVRPPDSAGGKQTASDVAANLELLSEFGEIKSQAMTSVADRVFVVLHGTIGWRTSGDVLSRRMSEALYATWHHDTFLMWSFMAPTSAELEAMPRTSVTFDDAQPIRLPLSQASR